MNHIYKVGDQVELISNRDRIGIVTHTANKGGAYAIFPGDTGSAYYEPHEINPVTTAPPERPPTGGVTSGQEGVAGPTPGPWSYIKSRTLIHIETPHDHPLGAGTHVCSVPKTNEANARLIAAAPELLAALQAIKFDEDMESISIKFPMGEKSTIGHYFNHGTTFVSALTAWKKKVETAIAKATGTEVM